MAYRSTPRDGTMQSPEATRKGPSLAGLRASFVRSLGWLLTPEIALAVAAGLLYLSSAYVMAPGQGGLSFGADTNLYRQLADPDFSDDRLTRFHPVTIALGLAWMQVFGVFSHLLWPPHLLSPLFAGIGALGVLAAVRAFRSVMSYRLALLCGAIYAISLGIWFFSSIPESKIVTASLASIYVAIYLHYREGWTTRGLALATLTLTLACLNELASAALIVIPACDMVLRHWRDRTAAIGVGVQALGILFAMVFLDVVLNGYLLDAANDADAAHWELFWRYFALSGHGLAQLYEFVLNWFVFNLAAPQDEALHSIPQWPEFRGYFEPALTNYFLDARSAALALWIIGMVALTVHSRPRGGLDADVKIVIAALLAYTAARATFFFLFNSGEAMLFSSATTLAVLLVLAIPFLATSLSTKVKTVALAGLAVLLLLNNARFMYA